MTNTYALPELLALPNDALNALAAELRGGTRTYNGFHQAEVWQWRDDQRQVKFSVNCESWTPCTSRDQSGELLQWAINSGVQSDISFESVRPRINAWYPCEEAGQLILLQVGEKAIPGNDARAETVAFCAAMLAKEGRLSNG